uniref:Uncharacterized protein n=1 Tax=Oryza punctata TaxID=4537 RepID=A0A0E0KG66_ORYPU
MRRSGSGDGMAAGGGARGRVARGSRRDGMARGAGRVRRGQAINTVQDRARRLLSKPIKFFNGMQDLFTGFSADGSLAMDQNTCMDVRMVQIMMIQEIYLTSTATPNLKITLVRISTLC